MHETIDLILGAVFVLFYSVSRFNTPPTNRSSTTAGRYYMALAFYCMVGALFYFTLFHFPHLLTFLSQGDANAVPQWAKEISSPLLIALLLTVLLPKLPILNALDNWVRKELQNMAAIPYEVRRLSAELRKAKFQMSGEEQDLVKQQMADDGFAAKDILFEPGHAPANRWTRLTVLFAKIGDWESDRKMSGYVAAFQGELEKLLKRYQQLTPKLKTCFKLIEESSITDPAGKTPEAINRYHEDLIEQITQLHNDLLDFISRGILHAELTDSARLHRLNSLGFTVEWSHEAFTLNQVMLLFGVVCLLLLGGFVIFSQASASVPFGVLIAKAILISVIYSVAVGCVVFPKERWKFAKHRPGEVRPIAFYFVAALMAVAISQLISLFFSCLLMRSVEAGMDRFRLTYPWMLVTFSTAIMTGILIDDPPSTHVSRFSRLNQRCLEGFLQAIIMLGVAFLTHYWLNEKFDAKLMAALPVPKNYQVPPLASVIGLSGIIGFVIGFCVPTWYREAPRGRQPVLEIESPTSLQELETTRRLVAS